MYRESTVKGRKPGLKSMVWSRRQKETFNQNRMKKQEFKKMRRGLGTSRTTLECSNIGIIGMPEGEEQEQEVENLFENNEGELPQSGKGNRLPGSPGSSESPKEVGPKEAHTKAHHNYITQDER